MKTKMISTKDLSYIKDMFNWNMTFNKKVMFYLENTNSEELANYLNEIADLTLNNAEKLVKLLESGTKNE